MTNLNISVIAGGLLSAAQLLSPTAAYAQADAPTATPAENGEAPAPAPAENGNAQAPKEVDAPPTPPGLEVGEGFQPQMEKQAGTGGDIAYASNGVVEVGGSGSLEIASAYTNLSLRPFVGWFVVDNLQLSAILEVAWSQLDVKNPVTNATDTQSNTLFGLYVEPSYHLPFTDSMLGFLGIGLGPTYDSDEFGFSIRPRLGMDFLLGRSGIFRPAFEVTYSTVDVVSRNNQNLVGVSTTYGLALGFSTML